MPSLFDNAEGTPFLARRAEYDELLLALGDDEYRGVLLIGAPGEGKTTLLRLAEKELLARGSAAFFVRLAVVRDDRDLGALLVAAVLDSPLVDERRVNATRGSRILRSSAGDMSLAEAAEILSRAGSALRCPVMLLDGLDEAPSQSRIVSALDELSRRLHDWKIVISSRPQSRTPLSKLRGFRALELHPLGSEDVRKLLTASASDLPPESLNRAIDASKGNPLFLRLAAQVLRGVPDLVLDTQQSLGDLVVNSIVSRSSDAPKLLILLERLALSSRPEPPLLLADATGLSIAETHQLVAEAEAKRLLIRLDDGNVSFAQILIRECIRFSRFFTPPFALADLNFGAEEAETDTLLEATYVRRAGLSNILDQGRTIVIGDRGSGKSAIFRKLQTERANQPRSASVLPLADPHSLLYRIVVQGDAPSTVEEYRAAWLSIVARVLASNLPTDAPKQLHRTARHLDSVFNSGQERGSRLSRLGRAAGRRLSGTSLSLAVGPVNLGVKAPDGTPTPTGSAIDIDEFLQSYDRYLNESGQHTVVPIDRVDELFKYERQQQESLVQGLFQAENQIAQLRNISIVVFLRTDLFEIYDIQEKNKLVSRTLLLEWSEEDWLRLLVNRVFANPQVGSLARTLGSAEGAQGIVDVAGAFDVLFPEEIEGQPVQRWLLDSVRNGNGAISPRLVVLLLLITCELSEDRGATVSTLPLFSGQALRDAMTRLSDLSYSEIVNDFKVASAFVANCRAGKLREFELAEVEALFEPADGPVSEQVRLLERLGFLERIIRQEGSSNKPRFRIPQLYTRCWDYA